ncbi:MAG: methyltransferase domain-containing protein [Dehalococcoidia bacterium]
MDYLLDIGRLRSRHPSAVRAGSLRDLRRDLIYDPEHGLPFRDNSFEAIYAFRVLETVEDPLALLEEIWRVGKPGAAVYIRVPHSSNSLNVWKDPEAARGFNTQFFEGFDPGSPWENPRLRARFHVDYVRLAHQAAQGVFAARNPLRILVSGLVEALANQDRSTQYRAERWWGPWVGGFEELQLLLTVAKEESNPFVV